MSSERLSVGRRRLAALRDELPPRHRAVVDSLRELHFATTRQIERLHFRGSGLTPLSAARTASRALEQLHRAALVDRLDRRIGGARAGSASFVWCLSPAGARLAGLPTRKHRHEPGRTHLDHVLDVAELVVGIHELCRAGDVDLLAVETEPRCWRRYLTPVGDDHWLKPDLAVTLGVGPVARHWFVEVDRDTEDHPRLRRKMRNYLAAWNHGSIQATTGVFPGVLWTAPDERRCRAIGEAIADVKAPEGMFRTAQQDTAIEVLAGKHGLKPG